MLGPAPDRIWASKMTCRCTCTKHRVLTLKHVTCRVSGKAVQPAVQHHSGSCGNWACSLCRALLGVPSLLHANILVCTVHRHQCQERLLLLLLYYSRILALTSRCQVKLQASNLA